MLQADSLSSEPPGKPILWVCKYYSGYNKKHVNGPKGKNNHKLHLVCFLSINQEKSISEHISSVFHTVSGFMFQLPTIFFLLYPLFILAHRMLYYNLSIYRLNGFDFPEECVCVCVCVT